MTKTSLLTFAATFLLLTAANAQVIKNGDFSAGHTYWEGAGKVQLFDSKQKLVEEKTGSLLPPAHNPQEPAEKKEPGTPELQITLNRMVVQESKTRLNFPASHKGRVKFTVVLKTSDDFVRNGKAPGFTPNLNWNTSGWYIWSSLVHPEVDFCIRVDADTHYYLPRNLNAGGDWQTLSGTFDSLGGSPSKVLNLVTAAGTGTIWIKSVVVEAL